jgi:hypothetical protein
MLLPQHLIPAVDNTFGIDLQYQKKWYCILRQLIYLSSQDHLTKAAKPPFKNLTITCFFNKISGIKRQYPAPS